MATAPVELELKSLRPTPRMKKVGVVAPAVTISRLGVKAARSAMSCALQRREILGAEAGHGVRGLEIARGLRFGTANDDLLDARRRRRRLRTGRPLRNRLGGGGRRSCGTRLGGRLRSVGPGLRIFRCRAAFRRRAALRLFSPGERSGEQRDREQEPDQKRSPDRLFVLA
jgi:hypothetical protein